LTSMERERRLAEIELLRNLKSGDDGLSALWTHWFQERGAAAFAKLLRAEELTAQGPKAWREAESMLLELMDEHGLYWTEPVNRLATLYSMQGRLEASEALCKIALQSKPWHFGALSGIVTVYADKQDVQSARMWAARRLPTFAPQGSNRRRAAWVDKAIQDATRSLDEAEKRLKLFFGERDNHDYTVGEWE
jgi:hypothetical protein